MPFLKDLLPHTPLPGSPYRRYRGSLEQDPIKHEKRKAYIRKWNKEHPGDPEKNRRYGRDYYAKMRYEVLSLYSQGEPKCKICGENRLPCLSLDHINGGGAKHRTELRKTGKAGSNYYRWLLNNYNPEMFQVLCMNCQLVKYTEDRKYKRENSDDVRYKS